MNEPANPESGHDHDSLRLRHVLTIVLVGAALGVGFNALQLSASSSRALAWVKSERRLVSLTSAAGAGEAEPPVAPPPAAGPRSTAPGTVAPADSARRDAAPARGARAGGPTKAPAKAGKAALASPPPPAASSVQAAPSAAPAAANLPAIPDSRDPIEVGLDVAQKFHTAGAALFLDARSAEEYAEGHIADAVSLPFDDVFHDPALAKAVDAKGRVLITYCGGGDCDLSRSLAFSLIDAGFHKVLVFTGGIPAWTSAGSPLHKGARP